MKASGVDVVISAAFSCLAVIVDGKAETNNSRVYRLAIAVLLQSFYSNGTKTHQELSGYMETARENLTRWLWVDCLI